MRVAITSAALVLLLAGTTTASTSPPALVEINSADWGDTNSLMRRVELERNARTSKLKLTCRRMALVRRDDSPRLMRFLKSRLAPDYVAQESKVA